MFVMVSGVMITCIFLSVNQAYVHKWVMSEVYMLMHAIYFISANLGSGVELWSVRL